MESRRFISGDVEIAFVDEGGGEPILLIHGFASNLRVNWASTGWIDTLTDAGRRVIAMDVRGHGESEKLYDPELYRVEAMARDAANLIDHLGLGRADVMGYSMGARITAFLAVRDPAKVRSAILGGLGMALVEGMAGGDAIVAALEAPSLDVVVGEPGRAYRKFAEQTRADLRALAACMTVARETMPAATLATIRVPVLVAVGEKDAVAGSGEALARLIPGAEAFTIPNRDHMLATGAAPFKKRALEFLEQRP
ncbi:MAG: alpha/beta hydrolase [Bauldia sp.]|nr:MAG: alpha/beta hydrolase [Bauldia sp.]